jgi:tetratricopeptide (TPR) repeat protein
LAACLKEDHQTSIALFSQALKNDRGYAWVYTVCGTAYLKLNQHKKAVSDFTRAIRWNPKYAGAFHLHGMAYEKMGDFAPALRDL